MTTNRQALSNKQNAQQSTGPRTAEGRAAVAVNALKHGAFARSILVPGERPPAFASHRAGILESLLPMTKLEEALAERIAELLWRLARVGRYEAAETRLRVRKALQRDDQPIIPILGTEDRSILKAFHKRKKLKAKTAELEAEIERRKAMLEWFAAFDELPDEAVAEGKVFARFFDAVYESYADADEDPLDDFELTADEEAEMDFLEASDGTKRAVLDYFHLAAKRLKVKPEAHLSAFVEDLQETQDGQIEELNAVRRECADLKEKARKAKAVVEAANSLPYDADAAKIVRAESSLHRQLLQTLHELERLQARRAGTPLAPPLALDVTLEHAHAGIDE